MTRRTLKHCSLMLSLTLWLLVAGCGGEQPQPPAPGTDQETGGGGRGAPAEPAEAPQAEPEPTDAAPAPTRTVASDAGLMAALAEAPADAALVMVARSPEAVRDAAQALLGDVEEVPPMAFADHHMPEGLVDGAGPAAVVIMAAAGELAPVELYAMADGAAMPGEEVEPGLYKVERPAPEAPEGAPEGFEMPQPPPMYLKAVGGMLATCNALAGLKAMGAAGPRLALTGADAEAIDAHLVWGRVNPEALRGPARDMIEQMQKQMAQMGQGSPAALGFFDWYLALLDQFGVSTFHADMGDEGVRARMRFGLKPGSALMAVAKAAKPWTESKAMLSADPSFLFAGWAAIDWKAAMPAMKELYGPLMDQIAKQAEGEDAEKQVDRLWELASGYADVGGPGFAIAYAMQPGEGGLRLTEVFDLADPKGYEALGDKMMAELGPFMKWYSKLISQMPGTSGLELGWEYKADAEEVAGVTLDVGRITFDVNLPDDAPPEQKAMAMEAKKAIDAIYGPNGLAFWTGVAGETGVVVMGAPAYIEQAIEAARGDAPPLRDVAAVKTAIRDVPDDAVGVGLLSIPTAAYMGVSMMDHMMTQQLPPAIKDKLSEAPPLPSKPVPQTYTLLFERFDGKGVDLDVVIPADEIRQAVTVGKSVAARTQWIMMQMMQGMGGMMGGPGMGGPEGGEGAPMMEELVQAPPAQPAE